MINLDFLKELNRFKLVLKKRVSSRYSGERKSMAVGSGLLFSDYREYVPGDDLRYLDWRVYGRTDKLFVKRFEEERNMQIHIILDTSGSMDFGKKIRKFDYAAMTAIGFAYMALHNNEKFQFSTFSDDLDIVEARKGTNQLVSLVHYVNKVKLKGQSNLQKAVETLMKHVRSRALVVIVSDFLFDPEQLKESLARCKKSEVLVVQVLDPVERYMKLEGDFLFEDSETQSMMRAFVTNRFKKNYKDRLEGHITKIGTICEQAGARFVSVTTDTSIFDTYYAILG